MIKNIFKNLKTTFIGISLFGAACYNLYKNNVTFDQFIVLITTASGFIFSKDIENNDGK